MNIFWLDPNPITSVQMTCDAHVRVGVKEMGQMLGTVYRLHCHRKEKIPEFVPRVTHKQHPLVRWISSGIPAWCFCVMYMGLLGEEFEYRFGKKHAYIENGLHRWFYVHQPILPEDSCDEIPVCCSGIEYDREIESIFDIYRRYINARKQHLFTWTKRSIPSWIKCQRAD